MRVNDALDDRQTQAGAAAAARSRSVDDVKALEDVRQISVGYSFAGVAHAQHRIAVARVELDPNAAALQRMTQRVVDEVDEYLR